MESKTVKRENTSISLEASEYDPADGHAPTDAGKRQVYDRFDLRYVAVRTGPGTVHNRKQGRES